MHVKLWWLKTSPRYVCPHSVPARTTDALLALGRYIQEARRGPPEGRAARATPEALDGNRFAACCERCIGDPRRKPVLTLQGGFQEALHPVRPISEGVDSALPNAASTFKVFFMHRIKVGLHEVAHWVCVYVVVG